MTAPQPAPPTHPVEVNPHLFEGDKVRLRPIAFSDCTQAYADWLNDPDVNRFLETRHEPQTIDTVKAFVARQISSDDSHLLAIIEVSTGRHIGNIKIGPVNRHHLSADISYFIGDRASWHKGYGTQAIKGVVKHAFNKLKLYNLQAGCYAKNVNSIKALKRNGFKERGRMPNALCTEGEKRDDHLLLSLTLPEYKSSMT